jgi:hypothetical protein
VSLPGVLLADGDAWLTQVEIGTLFGVKVPTVSEHIASIIADGECSQAATIRNFRTVRTEGNRRVSREVAHYSSDMVLIVSDRGSAVPNNSVPTNPRHCRRGKGETPMR